MKHPCYVHTQVWIGVLLAATFASPSVAESAFDDQRCSTPWLLQFVAQGDAPSAYALTEVDGDEMALNEANATDRGTLCRVRTFLNGELWGIAHPVEESALPPAVRELLPANEHRFEHLWLAAYEVEHKRSDGWEQETFVDGIGRALFIREKSPEDEESERPLSWKELPPRVRDLATAHLREATPSRIQLERDWGLETYAISWISSNGRQELKLLSDGRVLFLELPAGSAIPEAVSRLEHGRSIEALLLDVFAVEDNGTPNGRLVLSIGELISPAGVTRSSMGNR